VQRPRPTREDAIFIAVWCALTIAALVPVWHQRMLPMLDTPDHLALARAWHSYGDPSYRIAEHYLLRLRVVPYMAFYGLLHLLLYVSSIEVANKLILSLYLVVFPLSVLSLARALGRSRWLALGAFALAFNPGWIYGFSSYLLGTACVFFGLAALARWLDEGRPRDAALLCATTLLAYFAHVMAWALFGVAALALVAVELRRLRRCAIACALMAPSLLPAAWAWLQEKHEHAYMNRGDHLVAVWRGLSVSFLEFPKRILELFPGPLDMCVLATLAATTLALLVWPRPPSDERGTRRLGAMLGVLAVAYLALPYHIRKPMEWWYVSPRLPALMAPLILLLPAIELPRRRAWVMAPAALAFLVLVTHLTRLYGDFNRRNIGFMRLVDKVPRGSAALVLARGLIAGDAESSSDPATSAPVYWHFMSWPMALKGGFSPYLFDQGIPVRPRPGLPYHNVAKTDVLDFGKAPEFEWYIVRNTEGSLPADRVRIEAVDGDWTLYHRFAGAGDEP
jgi:hypothetical protein